MNIKQKLVLGISAIFMLTLTIVGVTYSYFVTKVTGDTPENIKLESAKFGVKYADGNGYVNITNILPGTKIYKAFTAENEFPNDTSFMIYITSSTSGDKKFITASDDNKQDCYNAQTVEAAKALTDKNCFDGAEYSNIYVTLKEYKGNVQITENMDQATLGSMFNESGNTLVANTQKLKTVKQNLGDRQLIVGATNNIATNKKYILELEYKLEDYNQDLENEAQLSVLINYES